MSAVLGVSVGTSAVRMATLSAPEHDENTVPGFERRAVEVVAGPVEDVAAQSIGVLLEHDGHADIGATGVAYGSGLHPDTMHDAMARQQLYNYHLVPEAAAVVALLESAGQLAPTDQTLVLYDLGSSGVTVTVVDRYSHTVLAQHRSDVAGGDRFDALVAEQQLRERGLTRPEDAWAAAEFIARCREAKEQLSTGTGAAVPGDGGLVLLNRERFEALVRVPLESSARLARDVIAASGRHPDVLVLLGGGVRIPLVPSLLQSWLGLRIILPPEPEMVAAQGAALLATPMAAPVPHESRPEQPEPDWADIASTSQARRGPSRRHLALAGAVAAGLVVVAAIGLALGGRDTGTTNQGESAVAEVTVPPRTTTRAPSTTTTTTPSSTSAAPAATTAPESTSDAPAPAPAPGPRFLNLPDPIRIEVPPNIQLPPGMIR
ncbi:Hsp70 family protein [Rhodococcus gannanensis]|uniref:Hsp70 family protein n=1 Tax=Rhodococcus gannanensis TaxID=1960308 RepID=A0ABW4PDJ0_9NOCA